jgi:hypothetical protein
MRATYPTHLSPQNLVTMIFSEGYQLWICLQGTLNHNEKAQFYSLELTENNFTGGTQILSRDLVWI